MTESEFEALVRGDRVRWLGLEMGAEGTILAVSWRSVLVEWDDHTSCSYRVWERQLLARPLPAAATVQ